MAAWTCDELDRIADAQELEIAPRLADGSLRKPVPIWVVRAGDDLYVRAAYGAGSGWHRVARTSREARIRAGDVEKDVTIETPPPPSTIRSTPPTAPSTGATRASSTASPRPSIAPRR
jgi:hypothetical protein